MAISWGSAKGRFRVGIDVDQSPANVSSYTDSVVITVRWYVRTDMNAVADNQNLTVRGPGFTDHGVNFYNSTANNNARLVTTEKFRVATSRSGSKKLTFSGALSGTFTGGSPSHELSHTVGKRPAGKPGAPTGLSLSGATSTSIKATCKSGANNGDAEHAYEWDISSNSNMSGGRVERTSGTSNTISDLQHPGTRYYVRVRGVNSRGSGPWSTIKSLSTKPEKPHTPARPSGSKITAHGMRVNYKAPNDGGARITDWEIRLETSGGSLIHLYSDGDGPPYYDGIIRDQRLDRDTVYRIRVRCKNSAGWSSWSSPYSFRTLSTAPDKPPAPTVTDITSAGALAHFVPASDGGSPIDQWQVNLEVQPSHDDILRWNTESGPSFAMTGLTHDTTYWIQVRARNARGWSPWSDRSEFTTKPAVPAMPATAPAVEAVMATTARAVSAVPDDGGSPITGYDVEVATDPNFTGSRVFSSSTVRVELADLTPATQHWVRTRAANAVGVGAWSPSTSFMTESGAYVKVDGSWRSAKRVWIKVAGSWRQAKVWKKSEGVWHL